MVSQDKTQFADLRVDALTLLGFGRRDNGDEIRAIQLQAAARFALLAVAANLAAATLVVLTLGKVAPLWALCAWFALAAATSAGVGFRRFAGRSDSHDGVTVGQLRKATIDGLALGVVWSVVPFASGLFGGPQSSLALWLLLSLLISAVAFTMAAIPTITIAFVATVGGSMAIALATGAGLAPAVIVLAFSLLVGIASFERGRALVTMRANTLALAERDETVSLLLREFEDAGADWLWEIDAQRRVVHASPRFAQSIGVDPKTVNGRSFLEILAGPTWEDGNFAAGLRELSQRLNARESFRDLLLPVYVGEEERWWEMTASPRLDEKGHFIGFRGVGSDVTLARESANKINRMARFDTLTGLPNRLMINETLKQALADADQWGGRCGFMMIDLDRFKAVNDTLGHPIGDRLLSRVSQRLAQLVSENEIIGRLGGDEFAVVVRDASDSGALDALAKRIIETLSKPYEVDQHTLYIGASVGIAVSPRDGRTTEMLIRSADLALYRSKDAGGGVVHAYDPQLHIVAEERRVLEIALRSALENDQFHLQYQPVVDADTGSLKGFEALLRWQHPEHGNIPPDKFVPLAEDARLIAPIGEWVLRTACHEASRWDDSVRIAVNVSPEQLHSPGFVTMVTQTLAQSGLTPDRLELEVTESVFLREGTGAVQVLDQLIDLGVRLSLDDFGTGYSSLGYLSRTRFTTIKIDRSFVQDASKNVREAVAIVRAVVALAQSLGMATTAEGVETEEEHMMVRNFGCTKVQGYYFGRPLPVEEARNLAVHPGRASAAA